MMGIELKPCPFCGGKAIMVKHKNEIVDNLYSVCCGVCYCATPWGTEKQAAHDWNRRTNNETD